MTLRLVTWNIFHGRLYPPHRFRFTRPGERYGQFLEVLRRLDWDVLLLQEAPPRWHDGLNRDLQSSAACVLTSRNSFGWLRGLIAEVAPELIASNEGGSDQTFVRGGWTIAETRVHTMTEQPERRQMLWTRLRAPDGRELTVANLHGSVHGVAGSGDQVVTAAEQALAWAGELPLVFGGDFNQSPVRSPRVFDRLTALGLALPTSPDAIDHLLLHGLEIVEAPHKLPDAERELGPHVQLSDHACVACTAGMK